MSTDIETLRGIITHHVMRGTPVQREALAALDRLVADRDSLRKALDDRHEADRKAWRAIMRAAGREVERLGTENASLRTIVSKCADALGNGAAISHDCSIAFMGELPSEIGLHVASLTEDRDTWKEQSDSLRAKLERVKEALLFYADPFGVKDEHGEEVSVPDFYSEMEFGDRARAILSELSADTPAQQAPQMPALLTQDEIDAFVKETIDIAEANEEAERSR